MGLHGNGKGQDSACDKVDTTRAEAGLTACDKVDTTRAEAGLTRCQDGGIRRRNEMAGMALFCVSRKTVRLRRSHAILFVIDRILQHNLQYALLLQI
jgi:hypothetical protein